MNGRTCSKCTTFKLWEEFPVDRAHITGYYPACRPCANARNRARYYNNQEKEILRSSLKYKRDIEYYRQYRKDNKAHLSALQNLRKKKIKKATPPWANIDAIYDFYKNCPKGYEVDHIIPLKGKTVSGLHVLENLQYLLKRVNNSKKNKLLEELATQYPTCSLIRKM